MDQLMQALGQPGRYQMKICILLCLNYFCITFNNLNMTFYNTDPIGLRCGRETNVSQLHFKGDSLSADFSNDTCIHYSPKESRTAWCNARDNCTWCGYNTPFVMDNGEWNMVTEFDLVCNGQYLRGLASGIFFLGVMLGGLFFGHLADSFGRYPVLVFTMYSPVALGVGMYFCESVTLFIVLRFLMGFVVQGLQNVTISLVMEYFHSKYRRLACSTLTLAWGIGVFGLAALAYFVRNWRWMQITSSLMALGTLSFIWYIPESLRWLLLNRKHVRAKKLVTRICEYNNLPDELREQALREHCESVQEEKTVRHNLWHLLRHRESLVRSLVLWFIWFALTCGYFGLSLSTGDLHGSKYTNFLIGSGIEIGAYLLPFITPDRFGRRTPLFVGYLIGGVACLVAGNIEDGYEKTALALLGRFGFTCVYPPIYAITSELYPTVLRVVGIGTCTFWVGIAGIIAPQISLAGSLTASYFHVTFFGSLSLVAALLVLLLPETSGQTALETVNDMKALGLGFSFRRSLSIKKEKDTVEQEKQDNETSRFV